MPSATLTSTFTGQKIRTQTQRRYVVVYDHPEKPRATGIEFRTDDIAKARAFVGRKGGYRVIFDLRTDTGTRAVR